MRRNNWIVDDFAIRPAGKPDECFYCGEKKGTAHKPDCVIPSRTVVVRASFEYVITVPDSSTAEEIEEHRNVTRWCGDNGVVEIENILEKRDCACGFLKTAFVREATPEDENTFSIHVKDLPQ